MSCIEHVIVFPPVSLLVPGFVPVSAFGDAPFIGAMVRVGDDRTESPLLDMRRLTVSFMHLNVQVRRKEQREREREERIAVFKVQKMQQTLKPSAKKKKKKKK